MKKVLLAAAVLTLVVFAGCGGQKNDLTIGHGYFKQGDCTKAVPLFDATIADPDSIMDLAYAYYLKGKCEEKGGDIPAAYEYYYAAMVVTCYAVANDTHANLNTYGRSDFCERVIPEMLAKLESSAGDTAGIKAKVDAKLHVKYLERFTTE